MQREANIALTTFKTFLGPAASSTYVFKEPVFTGGFQVPILIYYLALVSKSLLEYFINGTRLYCCCLSYIT